MSDRKVTSILVVMGVLALLLMVILVRIVSAEVVVVDQPSTVKLEVKPIPTQSIKVVEGTSRVYEDGSTDWQPASTVQSTYNQQR